MKQQTQSNPGNKAFKYLKLYAFLKTGAFFIGSAVIIGIVSLAVTFPLWSLSEADSDFFAVCTGIGCLLLFTIFFTFRLIRSINETRADEFFKKLFHIINFLVFLAIHTVIAALFVLFFSSSEIQGISLEVFFIISLFFQAGVIFSNFIAHRTKLIKKGLFLFYSISTLVHFSFWIMVFFSRMQFIYLGIEIIVLLSVGAVIYAQLKSPKKTANPVSDL